MATISNPLRSSVQLAALAFALSAWVEGSTQIRESFLCDNDNSTISPALAYRDARLVQSSRVQRFFDWLTRSGRVMDETEKTVMGAVHVVSSLTLLRVIGLKPLFPFIFSPFLSTFSIPPSMRRTRPKWSYVIAASLVFACLQEFQRFIISEVIKLSRRLCQSQKEMPIGGVIVRGTTNFKVSEGDECLICSEFGFDRSFVAQAPNLLQEDHLEELQGLCTTAPSKHLVHPACYLRWQREYILQRGVHESIRIESNHLAPSSVKSTSLPLDANLTWARVILTAAGLSYLAPSVRPRIEPSSWDLHHSTNVPNPPTLALHQVPTHHASALPFNHPIATLRTSSPPCPGCRSPIELHFHPKTALTNGPKHAALRATIWKIFQELERDALALVTGRTIMRKLFTQFSFLFTLITMLKPSNSQRYV
ncbi:hypothetical protein FRB99_003884 [Tulasnella sp. 403]|nr:hypothetical protein FRB99_003884 [Tulasnella sp. 403]